ncbi:glycine receptor subunit alpha-2-like isoform X1 [Stegodyphus dumicola]|uniref:glycine receptor subunit alpha-2-like isoform X1 n=1 Tax=Stegodyphus dumicola TaxID=202533 RepID=UPI0015B16E8C|nr:glycine receptor subunit alpha-2-like isoform X1 [Stegodyphus dumicola]
MGNNFFLCSFYFFCLNLMFSSTFLCESQLQEDDDPCSILIPKGYEKYRAPSNKGQPINVYIQLDILDIDEVNEETMDFRLHAYVSSAWNDSRLDQVENKQVYHQCLNSIWTPDLIFEAAKQTNLLSAGKSYFRIEADGSLYLSHRYSFRVTCLMHFGAYPFDIQTCLFTVTFMGTSDEEAVLKWYQDENSAYSSNRSSIVFVKHIEPLQFSLGKTVTYSVILKEYVENFTCLMLKLPFVRHITGSIINCYIPSTLIVIVSCVTFWLRPEAAPARVTLSITCLLTLCTQIQQYKSHLPPISYVTALDIWFFACIITVFSTLIVFAASYEAYYAREKEKSVKSFPAVICSVRGKHNSLSRNNKVDRTELNETKKEVKYLSVSRYCDSYSIDKACRKLFPFSFTVFAICYWVYYLSSFYYH